jgi:hypothetical protein
MKELVEFLQQKSIILKSLKSIPPRELGSRKRVDIYIGVDLKKYYVFILRIEKKSRFLQKDAKDMIELHQKAQKYIDSSIKKRYIIINAPLCSKAKALLLESGWRVWSE